MASQKPTSMGFVEAARVIRTFAPIMGLKPLYFIVAVFSTFFIAIFDGLREGPCHWA